MSRTRIMDIVALTREGWRPYELEPDQQVYDRLKCPFKPAADNRRNRSKDRPFWFVRDDVFCCIGCASHCTLKNPAGFQVPLPIRCPVKKPNQDYYITPGEMLARHDLLNAKQAAYCLNVSERTIYNYIAEGKLVRLKENPVRVRSSEVKALRENFDE
ncbi:MAG: helix-turn-helix domain-containing protein [Desulfovibrio sp.]|nr:helix-turn-helix domain-containing protein [Desulfovibrio sp.]